MGERCRTMSAGRGMRAGHLPLPPPPLPLRLLPPETGLSGVTAPAALLVGAAAAGLGAAKAGWRAVSPAGCGTVAASAGSCCVTIGGRAAA